MGALTQRPFFRIIVLGFLLALVVLVLRGPALWGDDGNRILITEADLSQLVANHERTWRRQPTADEFSGLLENYTREEVLYQEALKRGLDKNNMAIRRALVTQMDLLAETQLAYKEFSDEDVRAYYAMRGEKYRQPGTISFAHIYFSADKRGAQVEGEATRVIEQLNQRAFDTEDLTRYGDPFMLQPILTAEARPNVESAFGKAFTESAFALEPGQWSGPVRSAFGFHAVYVIEKTEGRLPDLEEVLAQVMVDLRYEEQQAAKEQFYIELMRQYQIVYEGDLKQVMGGNEEATSPVHGKARVR